MSCEGCISDAKNRSSQRDQIIEKAKLYAKENKTQVAIYQEAGEWKFITADIAYTERIPFENIFSQYSE